MLNMYRFCH